MDSFGDRMKQYEALAIPDRFMPRLPVIIRLDGVAFHSFTKGLKRPYDVRLTSTMIETAKFLAKETNAVCAYTQSDEITLILYQDNFKSQIYFDGKIQKILSVLASRASVFFNQKIAHNIPEKADKNPVFDCRAFCVPNKTEAINNLIWREQDAARNSVSMAAQAVFSHTELQHKTCNDMQEMLFSKKGINWNDYPSYFKRGTYITKNTFETPFTAEEIEKLPPNHEARKNKDLMIKRSMYTDVFMPQLTKVINKEGVIFNGERPISE